MLSDGKRPARPHQIEIDQEVMRLIESGVKVIGLNLPPGYGKSYLARAWQLRFGNTDIITCSNHLIDQYKRDYPELNTVKGKTNYATKDEYETAKKLARSSAPSVFNPLSALLTCPRAFRKAKCIIVDEAHTLGEMLRHAATCSFNASRTGLPRGEISEFQFIRWLIRRFQELTPDTKEFEKIAALYYTLVGHEQDNLIKLQRRKTVIRGRAIDTVDVHVVDYPLGIIDQLLDAETVILMSGTLTEYETEVLANGKTWCWVSRPYLPPKESRPVYVDTVEDIDRKNIAKLCEKIRRIYIREGQQPTLVHVTYGELHEYLLHLKDLRPTYHTSAAGKDRAEKAFKAKGGLWLAAGCAEGLDLPHEYCGVVIIPNLQFPNKGDMYVQKRMGKPDGRKWYSLKTLENTVQRLGRGLRNPTDKCAHYILDPYFPRLWGEYGNQFEPLNIQWGSK